MNCLRSRMSERGVVLPVVLMLLALIAVLALTFLERSRMESLVARNNAAAIRVRGVAEGGLYLGIAALLRARQDRQPEFGPIRLQIPLGEGASLSVTVADERGKIDINAAPDSLLRQLFQVAGARDDVAERLADTVLDWRDEDDNKRVNGAEARDYADAEELSGPANRPFLGVEELQQVRGMDRTMFRRLLPLVTVWSGIARIHLDSAPGDVLRALPGANTTEIDRFLEARRERMAGRESTPLPRLSNVQNWLASGPGSVYQIIAVAQDDAVTVSEAIVRVGTAMPSGYEILRIAELDAAVISVAPGAGSDDATATRENAR